MSTNSELDSLVPALTFDAGIPLESIEAMNSALKTGSTAAQISQIHVYDNAPHAFHADYRPSYRKDEAEDGWQQMLAWFRKMNP
ncbi:MAG: dienelactone hydrolase family protein [Azonexus sp.]|nr:dienelactone hydrolase family protein [Azonexus sp.]